MLTKGVYRSLSTKIAFGLHGEACQTLIAKCRGDPRQRSHLSYLTRYPSTVSSPEVIWVQLPWKNQGHIYALCLARWINTCLAGKWAVSGCLSSVVGGGGSSGWDRPSKGLVAGFRCIYAASGSVGLVYWGLTPQQHPGSYQGGEMMMKSVFWWRKPEYPEETTDLRQVTDETFCWSVWNCPTVMDEYGGKWRGITKMAEWRRMPKYHAKVKWWGDTVP